MILINGSTGGLGSDLTECLSDDGVAWRASTVAVDDRAAVWDEIRSVRPDVVLHLAAIVGTKDCDEVPAQAIATNVGGACNVAQAAVAFGARVVYYSSSAIFLPGVVPLVEDSPINHEPRTIYGTTKYWGEQVMRKYVPRRDLIVVRPCMGFGGARDRVSQLVALIRSHWTRRPVNLLLDMAKLKDYCPVRNISTAVVLLLRRDLFGATVNVGYGEPEPYGATIDDLRARGLDPCYRTHPEYDFLGDHVIDTTRLRGFGWEITVSRGGEIERAIARCRVEFEG